jgi:hypothetical protein
MLGPNCPHLPIGRKLASLRGIARSQDCGLLIGREINGGLILTGELQQDTRELVLHVGGQEPDRFDRMFEKLRHAITIT